MQYSFGSGSLFGVKTGTNSTPVRFGGIQNVTIDMSFTNKELRGQYQFPLSVARGAGKITGKAAFAQLNAQALNDMFFGQASNPASTLVLETAVGELQTVSNSNVCNVTNNTNFTQDLGVVVASTGAIMNPVTAGPLANQYVVAANGQYTFNNSQAGVQMAISYTYTDNQGLVQTVTNTLMGSAPTFSVVLAESYQVLGVTKNLNLKLFSCISSKLALAFKMEDFTIPDFEFEAQVNAAGQILQLGLSE